MWSPAVAPALKTTMSAAATAVPEIAIDVRLGVNPRDPVTTSTTFDRTTITTSKSSHQKRPGSGFRPTLPCGASLHEATCHTASESGWSGVIANATGTFGNVNETS